HSTARHDEYDRTSNDHCHGCWRGISPIERPVSHVRYYFKYRAVNSGAGAKEGPILARPHMISFAKQAMGWLKIFLLQHQTSQDLRRYLVGRSSQLTCCCIRFVDHPGSRVSNRKHCTAFTLIEIMVVVAIMGVVLTMGVPIVYKAWHKAPMSKAISDI